MTVDGHTSMRRLRSKLLNTALAKRITYVMNEALLTFEWVLFRRSSGQEGRGGGWTSWLPERSRLEALRAW